MNVNQAPLPESYEEQVYAGLLGKIIGVYLGRPFEGWSKQAIQDRWGLIDRYVHEDRNAPLVVSDDDISGTLTFIRALEDSGLYEKTPDDFFGKTWLNYLLEGQTVLWWGGLGLSTEHTAFLRLKAGIPSPRSGSAEFNGKVVAEQIGAQIFIDAFGMVLPGEPERAARLARRAAAVAHDGEALHAAALVAAMVSAAFTVKEMDALLDIGIAQIPADSLIAKIHRDVRAWAKEDGDWEKTWERINERYGYHRYGGNCHVVPNHAVMVMAWVYAPNDFHRAMALVNTAGWDTDCNAANVGAVLGVKLGLQGINAGYDFQSPFGDRVFLPTADGSRAITDVLQEALHVSRIGRLIMGAPEFPVPKEGAWHHFCLPGAQHGWLVGEGDAAKCHNVKLANVPCDISPGGRCLQIALRLEEHGAVARVETPLALFHEIIGYTSYQLVGTPRLYPGQSARLTLRAADDLSGPVRIRPRLRLHAARESLTGTWVDGESRVLAPGEARCLTIAVPEEAAMHPAYLLALEMHADEPVTGNLYLDRVDLEGNASFKMSSLPPGQAKPPKHSEGWISNADFRRETFSDDPEPFVYLGKNRDVGIFVTGNRDWRDYEFAARMNIHLAERAGLIFRYQGMERHLVFEVTRDALRLTRRYYEETVLAEKPFTFTFDTPMTLRVRCVGRQLTAWLDDILVLEANDESLDSGGAGFLFAEGLVGFREVSLTPAS